MSVSLSLRPVWSWSWSWSCGWRLQAGARWQRATLWRPNFGRDKPTRQHRKAAGWGVRGEGCVVRDEGWGVRHPGLDVQRASDPGHEMAHQLAHLPSAEEAEALLGNWNWPFIKAALRRSLYQPGLWWIYFSGDNNQQRGQQQQSRRGADWTNRGTRAPEQQSTRAQALIAQDVFKVHNVKVVRECSRYSSTRCQQAELK